MMLGGGGGGSWQSDRAPGFQPKGWGFKKRRNDPIKQLLAMIISLKQNKKLMMFQKLTVSVSSWVALGNAHSVINSNHCELIYNDLN